jgi:hypothetical protein
MEVQKRVRGNKVGKVVKFCELFQPLLDVIPRAKQE